MDGSVRPVDFSFDFSSPQRNREAIIAAVVIAVWVRAIALFRKRPILRLSLAVIPPYALADSHMIAARRKCTILS
jgi:hypothetical protein